MSRYQVEWYSDYGTRKHVIQSFHRLQYVRLENDYGPMVLTLPMGKWAYEDFKVGDIMEIWREKASVVSLQNDTAYFVQDWVFYTDTEGRDLIDVVGYDANWLLDTAIVDAAAASAQADKTACADDMIKAVVDEQLGASAGNRQKITVAPDLSMAASMSKAFSRRNVLTVCKEIAEESTESGIYLVFDVVRTEPGTFVLQTFTGQRGRDHGRTSVDVRLVGRNYGNLFEASFGTYHSEERNYCVIGGQGEEAARAIVYRYKTSRINSSKWNRREKFVDARNIVTTAGLEAEGDAKLGEYKPKQIMTGRLVDTPGMRFGIECSWGDIVSVEAFGQYVDCHINKAKAVVDGERGEQIDVRLRGEI